MTTSPRSGLRPAPAAHLALLAGVIWSLLPLVRGASLSETAWLVACGAATFWLVLVTLGSIPSDPSAVGRVALATSLLLVGGVGLGLVLYKTTHHRPLGAVTWAVIALALATVSVLVSFRLRLRVETSVALFGVASALVVWQLAPALGVGVLLEIGLGSALLVVAYAASRYLGERAERWWFVPAGLVALGALGAVTLGTPARLHQIAPVVAGPFGLLH